MERPTFTISEINYALGTAIEKTGRERPQEQPNKPGMIHNVYVAKRRALELSGTYWKVTDSIDTHKPTRYDGAHTAAVLDELTDMTKEEKKGKKMAELGITPAVIDTTERLLFSGEHSHEYENIYQFPEIADVDDPRTPYSIRGHHLFFYWGVVTGHAPRKIATNLNEGLRALTTPGYHQAGIDYAHDVIGQTHETAQTYKEKMEATLHEFAMLPPDYPIDLITAIPDKICSTCTGSGDHCKLKISPVRRMSTITHDREVLSVLVNEARELNTRDDLTVITKRARFTDAPDEMVEGIRTHKGTLKKLLRNASVNWGEIYNVFPIELHYAAASNLTV